MNIDNFNWGPTSDSFKEQVIREIFNQETNSIYEKIFQVEEGDIVVDIGSTVGEFPFSVLNKNPKHIYVVEPLSIFFDTLKINLQGSPVSFTNAAITSEKNLIVNWDYCIENCKTLTFSEYIEQNRLQKIDFLKSDCEGGEYDIFSEKNLQLLKTIPKIVLEVHLGDRVNKEKFRLFRDNILPNFENFYFYSLDGVDIKWDLYNEHFIEYYREVMLYIDNRN
jgi:FkbM family methyltransferase